MDHGVRGNSRQSRCNILRSRSLLRGSSSSSSASAPPEPAFNLLTDLKTRSSASCVIGAPASSAQPGQEIEVDTLALCTENNMVRGEMISEPHREAQFSDARQCSVQRTFVPVQLFCAGHSASWPCCASCPSAPQRAQIPGGPACCRIPAVA